MSRRQRWKGIHRHGLRVVLASILLVAVAAAASVDVLSTDDADRRLRHEWVQDLVVGGDGRYRSAPLDASARAAARKSSAQQRPQPGAGSRVQAEAVRLLSRLDRVPAGAEDLRSLQALLLLLHAELDDTRGVIDRRRLGPTAMQRLSEAQARIERLQRELDLAADGLARATPGAQRAAATRLFSILVELAGADNAPILGARPLPLRRLNLAAPAPIDGPTITPSYLDPDASEPGPDDLAGTLDASLHPEIIAQAQSLEFEYTRIFDFVRGQIRTEWYHGSQKGAVATLRSRSGNDADQASLLIALFRAAGLPSRYVVGTATVAIEDIGSSLGLDEAQSILRALNRAGVPHRPRVLGGRISHVDLEQVWVSAYVPYANYRGAVIETSGKAWLPFAPSIKRHELVRPAGTAALAAVPSIPALIEQYLQAPSALSPLALLQAQVEAYLAAHPPSTGYGEQLRILVPPSQTLDLLPASLPMQVLGVRRESSSLDESDRPQVHVRVRGALPAESLLLEATVSVVAASARRLTITYQPASYEDHNIVNTYGSLAATPAYLVHVRPRVQLGGELIAIRCHWPLRMRSRSRSAVVPQATARSRPWSAVALSRSRSQQRASSRHRRARAPSSRAKTSRWLRAC